MAELLIKKRGLRSYAPDIAETVIVPETNPVDKYRFISKLQVEIIINNDYIDDILKLLTNQKKSYSSTISKNATRL